MADGIQLSFAFDDRVLLEACHPAHLAVALINSVFATGLERSETPKPVAARRHRDGACFGTLARAETGLLLMYTGRDEFLWSGVSARAAALAAAYYDVPMGMLDLDADSAPLGALDGLRVWTDDCASIVPLLRWW